MKLATLRDGSRDGRLLVVSRDLELATAVDEITPNLQAALDDWSRACEPLEQVYEDLNDGNSSDAFALDAAELAAPLPRAYQWLDGSAFESHGRRMIRAFGLEGDVVDASVPLIYQGGSDDFLGPRDEILIPDENVDADFEGELGVVLTDVPMGTKAEQAEKHIVLATQLNDVSFRAYAIRERRTGFGWLHAKPSSAFAPVFVTIDELGSSWRDGRICLPLEVEVNGARFGRPDASEMSFSFPELIEYVSKTRRLGAGSILGSGTVSNADDGVGFACITERRASELVALGEPRSQYLKAGDHLRMEMLTSAGTALFGAIDQTVSIA